MANNPCDRMNPDVNYRKKKQRGTFLINSHYLFREFMFYTDRLFTQLFLATVMWSQVLRIMKI